MVWGGVHSQGDTCGIQNVRSRNRSKRILNLLRPTYAVRTHSMKNPASINNSGSNNSGLPFVRRKFPPHK